MPVAILINGDSIEQLNDKAGFRSPEGQPKLPRKGREDTRLLEGEIDACVTDPPYGFDFAGDKDWDTFKEGNLGGAYAPSSAEHSAQFAQFTTNWSRPLRNHVLRNGSHLLAFSSDRTIDLVGRGLREADYEIVRLLFWLYASGQVKNPNDTRPGCEPIFVGRVIRNDKENLNKLFKERGLGQMHAQVWKEEDGKHPTNMLISEEAVALDEELRQHKASFFVPKPSSKDRDWGCGDPESGGLPLQKKDNRLSHMSSNYTGKVVKDVMAQNVHPTVKPIELMKRLIRLVSRPGHTIIDPFMGSGTTGVAAILEGRNFVGIERDPDYFQIASTRIRSAEQEAKAA